MPGDMHYSRWSGSREKMIWMRRISMLRPRRIHELEYEAMPARRKAVADRPANPPLLGETPRAV
jgi:hypothetical protein